MMEKSMVPGKATKSIREVFGGGNKGSFNTISLLLYRGRRE